MAVLPQVAVSAQVLVFAFPVLSAAVWIRQDLFFLLPVQAVLVRRHIPCRTALPGVLFLLPAAEFRVRFLPDSLIKPEKTECQEYPRLIRKPMLHIKKCPPRMNCRL